MKRYLYALKPSGGILLIELLVYTREEACTWLRAHGYKPLYAINIKPKNGNLS